MWAAQGSDYDHPSVIRLSGQYLKHGRILKRKQGGGGVAVRFAELTRRGSGEEGGAVRMCRRCRMRGSGGGLMR